MLDDISLDWMKRRILYSFLLNHCQGSYTSSAHHPVIDVKQIHHHSTQLATFLRQRQRRSESDRW
jgi:hypothetical protein